MKLPGPAGESSISMFEKLSQQAEPVNWAMHTKQEDQGLPPMRRQKQINRRPPGKPVFNHTHNIKTSMRNHH